MIPARRPKPGLCAADAPRRSPALTRPRWLAAKSTAALTVALPAGRMARPAWAAPGNLDTTFGARGFGSDGKVTTAMGPGGDYAWATAIQPDGRIIAAGYAAIGASVDFALARYEADGSLDASFGSGGKVTTPIGTVASVAYSVATQPDGKILAAGYADSGSRGDFALVRYNADGSLDASFGSGGKVTTAIGWYDDVAHSIAIQPDGKILAGGYMDSGWSYDLALVRYNADGSLDTSFGWSGKVTTAAGTGNDLGYAIALQADGKIVLAGETYSGGSNSDFCIARYDSSGMLDSGFGSGGIVTTSLSTYYDGAYSVAIQADGKILAAGYRLNESPPWNYDFAVVRLNGNGSLDAGFGAGGAATVAIGASDDDVAYEVAVDGEGRVLLAGYTAGANRDMAVARLDSTGSLDTTFGSGGTASTPVGSGDDQARGMALDADGRIVLAGYAVFGANPDFALVRYNHDGTLDAPSANPGIVRLDLFDASRETFAIGLALAPDGKIVTSGNTGPTPWDFLVTRHDADGSRDFDFAGRGYVVTSPGSGSDRAHAAFIQPDGKIVIAGFARPGAYADSALERFAIDGTLDPSFDGDGLVTTSFAGTSDGAISAALQPDGKIVICGAKSWESNPNLLLARYNPDGSLDATFGSAGQVETDISGTDDVCRAVALQPDGKIVAGGFTTIPGSGPRVAVLRYTSSGALDTSFDGDGIATMALSPTDNGIFALTLQPDGKIVGAGWATAGADIAVVRLLASGAPDASFGSGGSVRTPIGLGTAAFGVAVDGEGRIVVGAAGGTTGDALALRYTSSGVLDPVFGTGGIAAIDFGGVDDQLQAIAVQPDGQIVGAGYGTIAGLTKLFLVRLEGGPICGDGTPEYGELCDQGAANGAASSCCSVACTVEPSSKTCRPSAGDCDVAESCDGTGATCPADTLAPSSTVCRSAMGDCDLPESCTGTAAACPADALAPSSTVCRSAMGDCDLPESCTGSAVTCPADALAPSSTVCRPVMGDCDLPESCTGSAVACPADTLAPSSTVCRPAAGGCDLPESCTGAAAACPGDTLKPSGTVCRSAAGDCDLAESCTGTVAACPGDALKPPSTVCRPAADACDLAESCDGLDVDCPADSGVPDSDGDLVCDAQDRCTNTAGGRDFLASPKPKLIVGKINTDTTAGNDKLLLQGEVLLPIGTPFSAINPQAHGARVLLLDAAGNERLAQTLPAGTYGGNGTRGWQAVGGVPPKKWQYLDKTGALLGGIFKMLVIDRSAKVPGQVRVQVLGKSGTYPVVLGDTPLEGVVVLGNQADAAAGYCAETAFLAGDCAFNGAGNQVTCKK